MKFTPEIEELRRDRAPQARAQAATVAACKAWREEPAAAAALSELEAFGKGARLERCPSLDRLFTGQGEAELLAASLSRHLARALLQAPLGHPPLRHGFSGVSSTLLLARSGRAQLLLQAREPGRHVSDSLTFSDALRYEVVLAGEGRGTIMRRCEAVGPDADLCREAIGMRPGVRLALDCSSEVLLVEHVERRLVVLRLHRTAAEPMPSTTHARDNGRLLHQSSGDLGTSRKEMMIALLGRMTCVQGAPLMAEMALEPGDRSMRWQALRECLALDTAAGFAALCTVARRADDPLAAEAGALRARLIEAYPQLKAVESAQCPA